MGARKQSNANDQAGTDPVCVIDSDLGVRDSISVLLGTLGLSVIVFPAPEDFLDWLKDCPPNLLITELTFPGMSGFELKEVLDTRGHDIPVIGLTSEVSLATRKRATRSGFFDLIEKPFMSELLLNRVRETLGIRPRNAVQGPSRP
jgi:FixJ family two-component response regulator